MWQLVSGRVFNMHDVVLMDRIVDREIIKIWIELDDTARGTTEIAEKFQDGLVGFTREFLDEWMWRILRIRHLASRNSRRRIPESRYLSRDLLATGEPVEASAPRRSAAHARRRTDASRETSR
jgi:hypothetical protein